MAQNNYYIGQTPDESLGDSQRYFYGIRRNDDGEVFLKRSDQFRDKTAIEINSIGDPSENFEQFEPGIDYIDGITEDHEVEYDNLLYTQYRWDNRNIFYYIDDDGQLIQRIGFSYDYPTGISS